jgi:transcriptional regulator with GAF, ATPase, and Fis domain
MGSLTATEREAGLLNTMMQLADLLVGDFDVVEAMALLTDSCVRLLAVDAAGLVLADGRGGLHVMASMTEVTHSVELEQLRLDEGPCVDAFRTGRPTGAADLVTAGRWPRFATVATDSGFHAVDALPLRLRGQTIGAMNLFSCSTGMLTGADLRAAQAMTHVATIAVLQYRTLHEFHRVNEQLQSALSSRIIIEQAKGRLVERGELASADDAFGRLRAFARRTNQRLVDVAHAVMDDTVDTDQILGNTPEKSPKRRP